MTFRATHVRRERRCALTIAASRIGVGVAGLLGGIGGAVLVATSDHLVDPLAYGLQIGVMVAGTTAVALYWARCRPGNRIATILLIYATTVAALSLQGASDP